MYNENYGKWILRSFVNHFRDIEVEDGIHFHIEGGPDKRKNYSTWVEFRVDGPDVDVWSDLYKLRYEVDLLLQFEVGSNIYSSAELISKIRKYFTCILITNDDGTEVGQLQVEDSINTINFGKLKGLPHQRVTVSAVYITYV